MVVVEVLGRLEQLPGVHTYFVQLHQWSARGRENACRAAPAQAYAFESVLCRNRRALHKKSFDT